MAKRKRTLAQKKRSDIRHQQTASSSLYTFSAPAFSHPSTPHQTLSSSFTLQHDLIKTLFVASVIVIFQLALFFLLHNHILVLPLLKLQY